MAFIASPLTTVAPRKLPISTRPRTRYRYVTSCEKVPNSLPADTNGKARSGDSGTFGFVGAQKLGVSFTCTANNCGTRISKMIRRSSYEKGTVLIMCPTCKVRHIISDHLGWYSDVSEKLTDIEKIANAKGEKVVRVNSNVFDLEKLISMLELCRFRFWLNGTNSFTQVARERWRKTTKIKRKTESRLSNLPLLGHFVIID